MKTKNITKQRLKFKTNTEYYKEAYRYYQNAKQTLKSAPVKYDRYQDLKPVREACGTCYLALLLALDGYFLERGINYETLPSSTEEYQKYLTKYLVHNGKVKNAFYIVYEELHIFGYYRGASSVKMIKEGFEKTKFILDILSKNKI